MKQTPKELVKVITTCICGNKYITYEEAEKLANTEPVSRGVTSCIGCNYHFTKGTNET